jgi:hypothetical protein
MTVRLVRKPPFGNEKIDRFKVTLSGSHTIKQKIAMLMQVKFWLHDMQGIDNAGLSDCYLDLRDENGHPLTVFRDGNIITDYHLVVESPYHCAADDYDRRPASHGPRIG